MKGLVDLAASDPYALIEKLTPAWAMERDAVDEAARSLRSAAIQARRHRSPERLLAALDALVSSVRFREEVTREFERMSREEGAPVRDLSRLREMLPEVAGRYTRLRKSGAKLYGLCPLHRDRRPSFFVYPNGTFFCFGCGAWGDAADLVSRCEGIPLKEAIRKLLGPWNR